MPFTTTITGTAELDNSILLAYNKSLLIANGEEQKLEQFVQVNEEINARSIAFAKYGRLPVVVGALNEKEDVASAPLSDSEILLTPTEHGNTVTITALSYAQTGGRSAVAASSLIGKHMGQYQDAMIVAALTSSTNVTNGVLSGATLDAQYSKLASKSVPALAEGLYVLLANEADIALIRNEAGFENVAKYANAMSVLKNEVGIYKGHRIVRHQAVPAGTKISFGWNAVGKAVSMGPHGVIKTGADKLDRFVHVGWHGIFAYGLIDTDAVEVLVTV